MSSCFRAPRVRAAGRDWNRTTPHAVERLLIERPEGAAEPYHDSLSTVEAQTDLASLVEITKPRWRIERDYEELNGHQVGNDALVAIGRVVKRVLPPEAFAGRLGGDEFIACLPHAKAEAAAAMAATIERSVGAIRFSAAGVTSALSICGANLGADHATPADLVRDADTGLHGAKGGARANLQPRPEPPAT